MRTVLIICGVVYVLGAYGMAYMAGKAEGDTPWPRAIRGTIIVFWPLTLLLLPAFAMWAHGNARAKNKASRAATSAPARPDLRADKRGPR